VVSGVCTTGAGAGVSRAAGAGAGAGPVALMGCRAGKGLTATGFVTGFAGAASVAPCSGTGVDFAGGAFGAGLAAAGAAGFAAGAATVGLAVFAAAAWVTVAACAAIGFIATALLGAGDFGVATFAFVFVVDTVKPS
jgi:hypothetical protein